MNPHVFVDESRRGSTYLLAAAFLLPHQLGAARALMRGLCLPGERRVHFQAENDSRRKLLISRIVASEVKTRVYLGVGRPDRVRSTCLTALVADVLAAGANRLVLETRGQAQDRLDRIDIRLALGVAIAAPPTYEHMCPHEEAILAIADGVAWAFGAGGDWRRRICPAVDQVTDLGAIAKRP